MKTEGMCICKKEQCSRKNKNKASSENSSEIKEWEKVVKTKQKEKNHTEFGEKYEAQQIKQYISVPCSKLRFAVSKTHTLLSYTRQVKGIPS